MFWGDTLFYGEDFFLNVTKQANGLLLYTYRYPETATTFYMHFRSRKVIKVVSKAINSLLVICKPSHFFDHFLQHSSSSSTCYDFLNALQVPSFIIFVNERHFLRILSRLYVTHRLKIKKKLHETYTTDRHHATG